jgi:hypothetical protein
MRDTGRRSEDNEEKPTAEDWSLPGKYGEIFREVEQALRRFQRSNQSEETET